MKNIIKICIKDEKLEGELHDYEDEVKFYCRRSICEVPKDALTVEGKKASFKIKIDEKITIRTGKVTKLIGKLSSLLGTSLRLVGFKKGCVELAFICTHELGELFPLSAKQVQQIISETKIFKIYSDKEVYYEKKAGALHAQSKCQTFMMSCRMCQ